MTDKSKNNGSVITDKGGKIDWFIFGSAALILFSLTILLASHPESSAAIINKFYIFVTSTVGVLYILAGTLVLSFLIWLSLSKYGTVVFGEEVQPEYSEFSWCSMLFCAGIGASLLYWSATEWVFYYTSPPFGITSRSDEAINWAVSYGIFHWGPVGWAFYCLPAIALGCSFHINKNPTLRLSAACEPVLKSSARRWPGRVIDLLFLLGVIATSATGLGFGTSVVSSAIAELTSIREGLELQIAIIAAATLIICISVYRGLDRGILVFSNANSILALVFITFVLVVGPTVFILEMGVTVLGVVTSEFITMLLWTDPLQKSNFVESWTIFYWAWWLAMGPFVGMFICKISKGRTIRQVALGMLFYGSAGCSLFFIVLGNYALHAELSGLYSVVDNAIQSSPSAAIAGLVKLLPAGSFWLFYLAVMGLIFMTTTYDSASYVLAAGASRELNEYGHPMRWHRLFWAAALGMLPVVLLFVGGLRELQTASLVASLPLLFVYGLLIVSILSTLSAKLSL